MLWPRYRKIQEINHVPRIPPWGQCTSRFVAADHISNESLADFMGVTLASLFKLGKKDLLSWLPNLGHRQSAALSEQQLDDKILEIQKKVQDDDIQIHAQTAEEDSYISIAQKASKKLFHGVLDASLSSWLMKPLTATAGMKEWLFNEHNIIRSFQEFSDTHYANLICIRQTER